MSCLREQLLSGLLCLIQLGLAIRNMLWVEPFVVKPC
jgi:hypothetical protein